VPAEVQLLELASDVRQVMEDETEPLLHKLALMGGAPHGARPKVLVTLDRKNNRMSNSENAAGTPLLVKFPAQHEHKEVCAVETLYGRIASACGILVPAMEYFDLGKDLSALGTERFDRVNGMRVPIHTAAGAAHVDFGLPQLDYITLLRLTQFITHDAREVLKAFERCVFNVILNNRDDHSKNFAFLMSKGGKWSLSPAYDLTYSQGAPGEHQMDICGEARAPARKHLLELANKTGIAQRAAEQAIEQIATAVDDFDDFVGDLKIRKETLKLIEKTVMANRARLL
jgi:serine/threonine-protein kinase HipA